MITPDFALVCLSRQRPDTLVYQTKRFFPSATVCVAESERDAYLMSSPNADLLLHPDAVVGIAAVRQWILDHVDSRVVFMVPDDIQCAYALGGTYAKRISNPDELLSLLRNTAECADAAGAKLCGYNVAWDVRKFNTFEPFSLDKWTDGPMGVLDRAIRFDQKLQLHPDLDFALQHLQKHRIIWRDNRFAFSHDRWKQQGGNSSLRSDAAHQREFAHIQQKWGAHFTVEWAKGTFISRLHVTRRDSGAA